MYAGGVCVIYVERDTYKSDGPVFNVWAKIATGVAALGQTAVTAHGHRDDIAITAANAWRNMRGELCPSGCAASTDDLFVNASAGPGMKLDLQGPMRHTLRLPQLQTSPSHWQVYTRRAAISLRIDRVHS